MRKKETNEITSSFNTDFPEIMKTKIVIQPMPTLPDINSNTDPFFLTDNQNDMVESLNDNFNTKNKNHTFDKSSLDVSSNQNTNPKQKPKERLVNKRKKLFNKLYGLDSFYVDNCKKAKELKYLPLEKYQNNLLNVIANHQPDQENFINLSNKFRELRLETETVIPLPKIDIELIEEQSKYQSKVNIKSLTLKQYFASLSNKSENENNQVRFKYRSRAKPYTNKVFNNLPPYLLETLQKKIKLHL